MHPPLQGISLGAEQDAIKPTPEMEKLLKASPGVVAARRRLEELKERLGM